MIITVANVKFTGLIPIDDWEPTEDAGLYIIMTQRDPTNKPNYYSTLYVGQSGDFSDRGFVDNHHKYDCWKEHANSDSGIHIGIHKMPGSTNEERESLESKIIKERNPPCND